MSITSINIKKSLTSFKNKHAITPNTTISTAINKGFIHCSYIMLTNTVRNHCHV